MEEPDEYINPWIHLLFELGEQLDKHDDFYRDPVDAEEGQLYKALAVVSDYAYDVLQDGAIPADLAIALAWYQPEETIEKKLSRLMQYNYVHRRAEFELTKRVLNRLRAGEKRIESLALIFSVMRSKTPSLVAISYLRRASELYLAGYVSEVFVMCGATLEAALAEALPDSQVRSLIAEKPKFSPSGVYSVGQRMRADRNSRAPIFEDDSRKKFWEVVNSRNDTVHVQVDLAANPAETLLLVAYLLAKMFPA